jgi:hypothetical protein
MTPRSLIVQRMLVAAGVSILGATALPAIASAQGFNNFNGAPTGPVVGSAEDNKKDTKQAAPPALPGSRVSRTEAAPAAPGAGDLPPTDALFDAINRGDMTSARDAVNRGADINGHNILGLSPLDLSIDLGRNEITFLLLSLRPATGRDAGPAPAAPAQNARAARRGGKPVATADATEAAAPPPAPAPVQTRRQAKAAAQKVPQAAQAPAQTAAAAPQAQQPRQYPSQRADAGTPIPQMGFLGFGSVTR